MNNLQILPYMQAPALYDLLKFVEIKLVGLNTLMAKLALSKLRGSLFWIKTHKLVSLVLAIILLVVGFFVYEKVALELNRLAFKSARHTIDTVYTDLVNEVGPPDNSKTINECSRSHVAIGDGPLSCSVNTSFIYGVSNRSEADQLMNDVQKVVKKHTNTFKSVSAPPSFIDITPAISDVNNSKVNYYSVAGLFCAIKYVYDTPRESDLILQNSRDKIPYFIAITCSADARAIFYPLAS